MKILLQHLTLRSFLISKWERRGGSCWFHDFGHSEIKLHCWTNPWFSGGDHLGEQNFCSKRSNYFPTSKPRRIVLMAALWFWHSLQSLLMDNRVFLITRTLLYIPWNLFWNLKKNHLDFWTMKPKTSLGKEEHLKQSSVFLQTLPPTPGSIGQLKVFKMNSFPNPLARLEFMSTCFSCIRWRVCCTPFNLSTNYSSNHRENAGKTLGMEGPCCLTLRRGAL